jgi:3-mercaptopyruvate sulfurtransferase SseA
MFHLGGFLYYLAMVWNSGVVAEDPIVTSCGTGVTACILALV